jgi:23S rRNA (guanosine2251-2'-O)-methyltransferase
MSDSSDLIFGKNPVIELLTKSPERVSKIYVRNTLSGSLRQNINSICSANKIPVSVVPGKKLYDLVGGVNDQGVVAECSPVSYTDYFEWIETVDLNAQPLVFILDELEDPHNLGAILRSAAAFNIAGVIVPKHKQAPISAAVIKTSAGTAGRVPIIRVTNTNQTIDDLKEKHFWIAGLESDAEKSVWEEDFKTPVAVILGSEGSGLRPSTKAHCDYLLSVPMGPKAESLNVSVTAGIVGSAYFNRIQSQ